MKKPLAILSMALAFAGGSAALAQVGPPPLRVKVLLGSDPHLGAAARANHDALLQSLASVGPTGGWFEFLPTGLEAAGFEYCTISAQDPRSCASSLLKQKGVAGATIIVLASGEGEHASWLCVGTGARPNNSERQIVGFDLNAAVDAASPRRRESAQLPLAVSPVQEPRAAGSRWRGLTTKLMVVGSGSTHPCSSSVDP
jgi:hypothetical protein